MQYYVVNIDNKEKSMESAIGYVPVSTLNQAEEGVSLEAQRRKIEAYCDLHDLNLSEIIEDAGISGKTVNGRPGIQMVIDKVKSRKVDNVVVFKLDRLARNLKEACEISELMQKKGVALHSISEKIDTGSATGKLFYHILSAMNQWEREVISERTVTAYL
jgi:site-specific DNA recombinase